VTQRRLWTKLEDRYIREHWPQMSDAEIGLHLGRTMPAVRQRRVRMEYVTDALEPVLGAIMPETPDADDTRWQPTEAIPGSPEKVAVLAYRLAEGLPLWHPGDWSQDDCVQGDEW